MPLTLTEQEKSDLMLFLLERQATFQRWKKSAMWVMYGCGAVGFVGTLILLSQVAPEFSFGFPAACAGGLVFFAIGMWFIMPRLPTPFLRCPFCSGRIPLFAPTPFAAPLQPYKVCPNCERPLQED